MARKRRLTDYTNVDLTVKRENSDEGRYGQVYFGPNCMSGGQWLALKALKPEVVKKNPALSELFKREGLIWLSMWPHANILPAHGVTEIDSRIFIVLTYAQHGSLAKILNKSDHSRHFLWSHKRLLLSQRLLWAQMIASGLDRLHKEPVVHRDLKPDNIVIQQNGFAQITDFGLAKIFEEGFMAGDNFAIQGDAYNQMDSRPWRTPYGVRFGAPPYRAPEQWQGIPPTDTYTDMYAFGVILSELLTGRHALLDWSEQIKEKDWEEAHLRYPPRSLKEVNLRIPDAIELLYEKCLEKNPLARPSAHEALLVLQAAAIALGHQPYQAPEVLEHTPENEASVWQNLSTVYARFGRFNQALDWNDMALRRKPDSRMALLTRANILSRVSGIDESIQAYDKVLALTPPTDHTALNTIYFDKATLLGRARRFYEADVAFSRALDAMPKAADVWNNRGVNQMHWALSALEGEENGDATEHIDLAIKYVRQAMNLNKKDSHYEQTLSQFEAVKDRKDRIVRESQQSK